MRRISESDIVKSPKPTFYAGDPQIALYNPDSIIVIGEESDYQSIGKSFPSGNAFLRSGATSYAISSPETELQKLEQLKKDESLDTPQLVDIENVTITKYFDPVTKVEKAKAVIKIRNSSINKSLVAGVDARIYQPRGI